MAHLPNKTRFRYSEQIASDVLGLYQQQHGNNVEIPVPVENIAIDVCKLHVNKVDMSSLGKNKSGALLAFESQILVNDSDITTRTRFNIAHEIAHWALEEFQTLYKNGLTSNAEDLADRIAGALLMPEESIKQYLENEKIINKETIVNLATAFRSLQICDVGSCHISLR